jgi:hypothetical protein
VSIFIDYPIWFIFLCLAGAVVYATALYLRDHSNRNFSKRLIFLLAGLRFLAIALLAFFLLKPLLKTTERRIELPIIAIAADNSGSLLFAADSASYKKELHAKLKALSQALANDHEVNLVSFGETVSENPDSLAFQERATDYSQLYDYLFNTYSNRNLGAVIIASDGIFNRGSDPVYNFGRLKVPVYSIALGDTTPRKDLYVVDIAHNKLAYLGNSFPVEILAEARELAGETAKLSITEGGKTVFEQTFPIEKASVQIRTTALLEASKPGVRRFTINLESLPGEVTLSNNRRDFFIDVLDSRQKILILGTAPHPDIAAIKDAIASNLNYQVESILAADFDGDAATYSLIVFHQIPGTQGKGAEVIRRAREKNIPALFVVGGQSDLKALNQLGLGISATGAPGSLTEVGATVTEGFSLFSLNPETEALVRRMPPLSAPVAAISQGSGVASLITKKVGLITTDEPLMAFNSGGETKTGFLLAEGIWRWRLMSFLESGSHDFFNDLFVKTVQYLSSKEDKSQFRVKGPEKLMENERILFQAELYNEAYEPVMDADIKLEITGEEGAKFPFSFSAASNGQYYRVDAGNLPPGNYAYSAQTNYGGKTYSSSGEFTIVPLQYENTRVQADHRVLNQLAMQSSGTSVPFTDIESLAELIRNNSKVSATSFEERYLNDLINEHWILAALLLFLALEWLLRKRNGSY